MSAHLKAIQAIATGGHFSNASADPLAQADPQSVNESTKCSIPLLQVVNSRQSSNPLPLPSSAFSRWG